MDRFRVVAAAALILAACLVKPPEVRALQPEQQWSPGDCLGPADPFCAAGGSSSGGGGAATCSASSICRSNGIETGSVSCTGTTCSRGTGWVKCNGTTTYCGAG